MDRTRVHHIVDTANSIIQVQVIHMQVVQLTTIINKVTINKERMGMEISGGVMAHRIENDLHQLIQNHEDRKLV